MICLIYFVSTTISVLNVWLQENSDGPVTMQNHWPCGMDIFLETFQKPLTDLMGW